MTDTTTPAATTAKGKTSRAAQRRTATQVYADLSYLDAADFPDRLPRAALAWLVDDLRASRDFH